MEWWMVDVVLALAVAGVWARVELFVVPRIQKAAARTHKEVANNLVADTHEQTERLVHLIQNHINGPAHRR